MNLLRVELENGILELVVSHDSLKMALNLLESSRRVKRIKVYNGGALISDLPWSKVSDKFRYEK